MKKLILKQLNNLGVQEQNQTQEQIDRLSNLCDSIAILINEYEIDSYIDIDNVSDLDTLINEYRNVRGY